MIVRLEFSRVYDQTYFMAQLPPQKRRKRRVQLREAQRRRRARLKEESKSFLQIILDEETLRSLRTYSDEAGKPLHICAAELIRNSLPSVHSKEQGLVLATPSAFKEGCLDGGPEPISSLIGSSNLSAPSAELSLSLPKAIPLEEKKLIALNQS